MCFIFWKCIFLAVLIQYTQTHTQKLIFAKYYKTFYSNQVFMAIGKLSGFNLIMQIDLTSQYNWVSLPGKSYPISSSTKIIKEEIDVFYSGQVINGKELEDVFNFDNNNEFGDNNDDSNSDNNKDLSTIRFYILDSLMAKVAEKEGVISLPFVFKDPSHSLIHFYYNKGLIDKLAFSLIRNFFRPIFIFGGIPIEETENKAISYCNVFDSTLNWDCSMPRVLFRSNTDIIDFNNKGYNNKVTFNTAEEYIDAPKEFIDKLYDYYISANYKMNCNTYQQNNRRQLYCSHEYDTQLYNGVITFTIGDYAYELKMSNFWICNEESCILKITQHLHKNEWILGTGFFNTYNVLFDYPEKKVIIYSINGVTEIGNRIKESKQGVGVNCFVGVANCIILIGGIGILLINKRRIR